MKLWQVIQWGNIEDGGNGPDTQCVVSAIDMPSAIAKAEIHFPSWSAYVKEDWNKGADVVYLIGQDDKPDGDAVLVIPVWVMHAFNLTHNPPWYFNHETKGWDTQEEMYGPESK